MNRQRLRNGLLMVSLLLFPVVLNYMSPYIVMDAAAQGIINGSLIVFAALFVSSLFVGRLWCGWLCPGSGLNNLCSLAKPEPAKGGRRNLIKYVTWALWMGAITYLVLMAGGYTRVDLFHLTETGISVSEPQNYVIYYGIVGLIVVMNLVYGRGAMCHYLCWIAPFMVIGNKIKNTLRYPSLRLTADAESCVNCGACTRGCPMGLNVQEMVQNNDMLQNECIYCASCIDTCPRKVIKWSWN
jgi:ferredoxin-type protein NapH